MPPVLLAHGVNFGGTTGGPAPDTETNVTIDTTGATFLIVSYTGDALQGDLDTFDDSAGNTWNRLTNIGDRPYYPFITATAAFYWCQSPITSATHTFTAHCISGTGHGAIEVMAWSGMTSVSVTNQETWLDSGTGTLTLGPVTVASGVAFAICTVGFGDITTNAPAILATDGWTIVDTLAVQKFQLGGVHGANGITAAYKFFSGVTPAVTNDWTFATVTGHAGAGIFQFAYTGSAPPATVTYPIRRLRRFALPWDDANRQKFISRVELILQSGIGTADVPNPQVMLRLSKDGGKTWGSEIQMTAGAMGEYAKRAYSYLQTQARNPVIEVSISDPVDWQFVQFLADMETGTS